MNDLAQGGICSFLHTLIPYLPVRSSIIFFDGYTIDYKRVSELSHYCSIYYCGPPLSYRSKSEQSIIDSTTLQTYPFSPEKCPYITFLPYQVPKSLLSSHSVLTYAAIQNYTQCPKGMWEYCSSLNIPHIAQIHGTCDWSKRVKAHFESIISNPTIYCVSQSVYEHMGKPDNHFICPAPVDSLVYYQKSVTRPLYSVVSAGRLAESKRHHLTVPAVHPYNVTIYGDGCDYVSLKPFLSTITHKPWTSDMASVYRSCSAFVGLPLDEGGPLTAIEALCCGTPTFFTPVGVLPELLSLPYHSSLLHLTSSPEDCNDEFKDFMYRIRDPSLLSKQMQFSLAVAEYFNPKLISAKWLEKCNYLLNCY